MKKLLGFIFLIVYLAGMILPYRTVIDFYLHRDDYTQRFCERLDEGITTCRASCYLDKLIEQEKNREPANAITVPSQVKSPEVLSSARPLANLEKKKSPKIQRPKLLLPVLLDSGIFHPPRFTT